MNILDIYVTEYMLGIYLSASSLIQDHQVYRRLVSRFENVRFVYTGKPTEHIELNGKIICGSKKTVLASTKELVVNHNHTLCKKCINKI